MDALTWFGLVAVSLMLVFYALEDRSAWFVLACSCILASAYGFIQGAWPFGVGAGVAGARWRQRMSARAERGWSA